MDIYGKLRFCSDDSLICAPLHSFINDGSEFCELSGFETNHIFVNCYNGPYSKKIVSHKKLIKDKMMDKIHKSKHEKSTLNNTSTDTPSIFPTISCSDIQNHIQNVPSLQNLNL